MQTERPQVTLVIVRAMLFIVSAFAGGVLFGRFVFDSSRKDLHVLHTPSASSKEIERIYASIGEVKSILAEKLVASTAEGLVLDSQRTEDEAVIAPEKRIPLGPAPTTTTLDEQVKALSDQIDILASLLESLQKSIADGMIPAIFPSLELLRRTPVEQDWTRLQQIVDEAESGQESRDVMMSRLLWMSQEDVLFMYGRPSRIFTNGNWEYSRKSATGNDRVVLHFIQDYVINVTVYGG